MKFLGYERPDGSVGIRNHVLVLPSADSTLIATKICEFVAGARTVPLASGNFVGRTSRDRETAARTLIGLGRNPNVASVIVDTDGRRILPVAEEIARSGKRVEVLQPERDGGTLGATEESILHGSGLP